VYVRDPYAGELYRMNTVFKATHLAFVLLAVAAPALLGWLRRRRPVLAAAILVIVLGSGLPHLAALVTRIGAPAGAGWGGLAWMAPGEADAARWIAGRRGRPVLVEAVGDAYSDAARIASASGVPVVLGWENHERVWRGNDIGPELERRRALVEAVYQATDPAEVSSAVADLGATHVVIGAVERRTFPYADFAAIRNAGTVVFAAGGCEIVRVRD